MNDAIIFYMTHAEHSNVAEFMLPHWERFGIPITIFSPSDSPVGSLKHQWIAWGQRGACGDPQYDRIIHILELFLKEPAKFALLVEFDCMCLLDSITFRHGLHGTPQLRYYEHALEFMAERYVTPPYMLDRMSAQKMLEVAKNYPDIKEGGNSDRLLAALAGLAGVPVLGFPEGSWSKLMPRPEKLEADMKDSLRAAVKSRCKWFHFIKTKEQFDFVNSLR